MKSVFQITISLICFAFLSSSILCYAQDGMLTPIVYTKALPDVTLSDEEREELTKLLDRIEANMKDVFDSKSFNYYWLNAQRRHIASKKTNDPIIVGDAETLLDELREIRQHEVSDLFIEWLESKVREKRPIPYNVLIESIDQILIDYEKKNEPTSTQSWREAAFEINRFPLVYPLPYFGGAFPEDRVSEFGAVGAARFGIPIHPQYYSFDQNLEHFDHSPSRALFVIHDLLHLSRNWINSFIYYPGGPKLLKTDEFSSIKVFYELVEFKTRIARWFELEMPNQIGISQRLRYFLSEFVSDFFFEKSDQFSSPEQIMKLILEQTPTEFKGALLDQQKTKVTIAEDKKQSAEKRLLSTRNANNLRHRKRKISAATRQLQRARRRLSNAQQRLEELEIAIRTKPEVYTGSRVEARFNKLFLRKCEETLLGKKQ